jgi:hypothetical protein
MARGILAVTFLSVLSLLAAPAAATLAVQHLTTDAEMLTFLSDTLFVGEGRIGDRGGAATFEVDLGGDTGAPATQAQYNWPNGGVVSWSLVYDSGTNLATFTVDNVVLNFVTPLSGFTDLFVRTRAVNAASDILVTDMTLDAENVADSSSADGDASGLDILWISGGTLTDGFSLSGTVTMSWTGTAPTQSRLAFQIKVGKLKPVGVEETTWGGVKALYGAE